LIPRPIRLPPRGRSRIGLGCSHRGKHSKGSYKKARRQAIWFSSPPPGITDTQ
jgi:hypothetical protein